MVLNPHPGLSRALLLLQALLLALLVGCMKHPQLSQAPTASPAAIAAVLEFSGKREVRGVPEALLKGISQQVRARNLPPEVIPAASYASDFEQTRATAHRLARVAELAGDAEQIVLVETMPEFYSQLNGKYRWTVKVEVSIAPRRHLDEAITSEFRVPVFLQFDHEREPEALKAAIPIIERHLAYLLDEYVGGMK